MKQLSIKVNLLNKNAQIPVKSHKGDAAYDLFATQEINLKPGERKKIPCGISLEIPEGYFGAIAPRSGLAHQYGLALVNSWGVVDSSYRGEICVIIINLGDDEICLPPNVRIAQLLILPAIEVGFIELNENLNDTDRGVKGFGSTGL